MRILRNMNLGRMPFWSLLLAGIFFLAACSSAPATGRAPTAAWTLLPYSTHTPAPSPLPPTPISTLPALPSPTPFLYTVEAGDTLSGIALKFNVSLGDLMAANPGIAPAALSIGQKIRIPTEESDLLGEPTPTPAPLPLTQTRCYPVADGGAWCFALLENNGESSIGYITAQMTLLDAEGNALQSQTVALLRNVLLPSEAFPLVAYFPPPLPAETSLQVRLLTAAPLRAGNKRYLPVRLQNVKTVIAWDGRSASVEGEALPGGNYGDPLFFSIAAAAYDAEGNVVGAMRWDSDRSLREGSPVPFKFNIYSAGGDIARVSLLAECWH